MVTPWIIIPCYESDDPSWMPFGSERLARFQGISGDSEKTISNQPRYIALENQCLLLVPMNSGI